METFPYNPDVIGILIENGSIESIHFKSLIMCDKYLNKYATRSNICYYSSALYTMILKHPDENWDWLYIHKYDLLYNYELYKDDVLASVHICNIRVSCCEDQLYEQSLKHNEPYCEDTKKITHWVDIDAEKTCFICLTRNDYWC